MQQTADKNSIQYRIVLGILFLEFSWLLFSGVGWSGLHGDSFFSLGVDPLAWLVHWAGFTGAAMTHLWVARLNDLLTLILIISLFQNPRNRVVAIILFLLMMGYYVFLTSRLGHRNYQAGMFLVLFPFMFAGRSRQLAFEGMRYFLLFFYASAAFYKLVHGGLWDMTLFSGYLPSQWSPYFLEGNTGWRTSLAVFLWNHPVVAQMAYWGGFLTEAVCLVGFITRRVDRLIGFALLLFHLADWVLMDIGAVGQLAFIMVLFFNYAEDDASDRAVS